MKDPLFQEALLKGGALIPDGISMVLAFKFLRGEKIERTAGWDLFQYEMNKLNQKLSESEDFRNVLLSKKDDIRLSLKWN